MDTVLPIALKTVVFALMIVVGVDCESGALQRSLRRFGLVAAVTAGQFLLIPLVTLGVCRLLGVSPDITAALLLLACCPSGTISNSYTFLARGNTALSVSLTLVSCLVAVVATPVALWTAGRLAALPEDHGLRVPVRPLLEQLALMMLFPLAVGFGLRARFREAVGRHLGWLRFLSAALIIGLIVLVILSVPVDSLWKEAKAVFVPAVVLTAALVALGIAAARALRLPEADRTALVFEFPCRNLAIVALVGLGILGKPGFVLFATVTFVIQASVLLGVASFHGRASPPPDDGPTSAAEAGGDGA